MKKLALLILSMPWLALAASPQQIDHGRFEKVRVWAPAEAAKQVVLYLGPPAGWLPADDQTANALLASGALVIGIDGGQMRKAFDADGGDCVYPAGDFENLSRFVQAYTRQPETRLPVLVSQSDGALVYAALAQVPPGHFAGGVSYDFSPSIALWEKPLCAGEDMAESSLTPRTLQVPPGQKLAAAAALANPMVVLTDEKRRHDLVSGPRVAPFVAGIPALRVAALPGVAGLKQSDAMPLGVQPAALAGLKAAVASLSARARPLAGAAPPDLKNLPVIEDRAPGDEPTLAIFWSGDGGWATIDKEVSENLQAHGISVVGVDSLRYFWSARTPQDVARDTAAIARHYLAAWGKKRLVLIGFSQGADVLPFALSRLDPALRKQVSLFAALSLSKRAVFEFHLSNWVSDSDEGMLTAPEIAKLGDIPTWCFYGEDDADSVCGELAPSARLTVKKLPGDHHFDGDHATLAKLILAALPR